MGNTIQHFCMSRADDPKGLELSVRVLKGRGSLPEHPEGVRVSQWARGRGKDPMRVLQGKRGSGGVSIRGPTRQEGLSTGQELGGAQWVQHSKKRVPLWDRKVSTESQRARRGSPKEQRGAQGVPQHKKFPKGAEGCPWMSHRAVAAPSKHKAGPPSLSPHSLLRQLRQRQFLHLQDPAQEQESPGERGKESGISREPGVRRESAGTGPGTYRRHTCSPGGPLLGSARLSSI